MRSWTHAEEEALRILSPLGSRACAVSLDRSIHSVRTKANELGISLKRRKGFDTLSTRACRPTVLKRVKELTSAALCPACGYRAAAVKTTGLCGLCHVKGLKAVHEEEIENHEAQCQLWAARSKLQRRRRKLAKVIKEATV